MTKLRHPRLPRRLGVGLALIVAVAAIAAIVLTVNSPPTATNASASSTLSGAAAVQRRDLVQTDTESGTLSYANPQTVYDRLSGTITWLPAIGQVIKPGQALYRVSGRPVVLMNGTTPAYRDLSAADTDGADILQLNRDLIGLGFDPEVIVADDVWQPATTAGVELFQESLGEAPTGVLTLGEIVFLPGQQVVSALQATLGSSGGGLGSPAGSASAASYALPSSSSAEFVSLNKAPAKGQTGPTGPSGSRNGAQRPQSLAALVALLKAETAQLREEMRELRAQPRSGPHPNAGAKNNANGHKAGKGGSATSGKSGGGSAAGGPASPNPAPANGGGSGGGSATSILQTSSTQLVATVDLDPSKQSEARVGEKVTVELPASNTVNGTITAVSSVAQSSSGTGGSGNGSGSGSENGNGGGNGPTTATVPVTIALGGHVSGAGLDQAAVSVNFAQARANNVLSVPVTALLARSGGGYAVQEAGAPHKLIPVSTGLFAAGYVQISGPGIYPGLQVTDSQG